MTVDEYNERLKELLKIQMDAKEKFYKAKRAVIVFKKEYCYEIVKQYESKIGKKVVIHYKDWQGKEKITKKRLREATESFSSVEELRLI